MLRKFPKDLMAQVEAELNSLKESILSVMDITTMAITFLLVLIVLM